MASYVDPAVGPWPGKKEVWRVEVAAEWIGSEIGYFTATIQFMPFEPAWESTVETTAHGFRDAVRELMERVRADLPTIRGGRDRDDPYAWLDSDEMMMGD